MIDKAKLAERIRQLQELTTEEKSSLLELLNTHKKYGLVWEEKEEEVEQQLQEQLPVLEEVVERKIVGTHSSPSAEEHNGRAIARYGSTGEQTATENRQDSCVPAPNHILIEGDNLHALTCLSYTHEGKIDVIYIDPPYNTGNKDFVYNDRFVDTEDAYRHSKWLSFMHKRLRIARRLLSPRGVIFISIDDNEQANLKLLCDEVFGEGNFEGQLILKTATDNNPSQINTEHEYMICYANNKSIQDNWQRTSQAAKLIIEKYNDLINSYGLDFEIIKRELRKWINANKANLPQVAHYNNVDEKGVYSSSSNSSNPHPGGYMYDIIHPITHLACPKPQNGWRWPLSTFQEYDRIGEIEWGIDEKTQPHVKKRIETSTEYLRTLIYEDNRGTTKALSDIFDGEKVFDNPKPDKILARIIDFASQKHSTILDFFAGSGTTLHAVMQLNKEDGGHRQCILVTNNENGICENVTYERNKRVINGYTTPKGEAVEGLKDNNLRYYRTAFVPRERTQHNMRALVNAATDLLCIKENLYQEQDFFIDGKRVSKKVARRFSSEGFPSLTPKDAIPSVSYKYPYSGAGMLIIYQEEFATQIAAEIAKTDFGGQKMKIYIFSPGRYAFDDTFAEVQDKVQLVALPAAIYDAYKRILPKKKDKPIDGDAGTHSSPSAEKTAATGNGYVPSTATGDGCVPGKQQTLFD